MTDEYIVFYTGHCGWSAVSTSTGQTGFGYDPKEAVNNAIKAADQLRGLARDDETMETMDPAAELTSKLAQIAQPLDCDDYNHGVVYRYVRSSPKVEIT
jgi:hypothetical protein